ncbi:MAG TPA: hypothetical protein PKH81_01190 [Treponemataceae bacterium]|nr:hypothetical protein [Treponemataceae bacterium]
MKKLVCSLCYVVFLTICSIHSAVPNTAVWELLTEAEILFESGEFGKALTEAERARTFHQDLINGYSRLLSDALIPREVKKAGTEIGPVRDVLLKRNEIEAVGIVDMLIDLKGKDFFKNSIPLMLTWLSDRSVLPEADILCGMIYEAEGEYRMASSYFLSAWKHRAFLDVPSRRFEILYRLADMSHVQGEEGRREEYLLLVLAEDAVYSPSQGGQTSLRAMINTLESNQDTEKFFSLYRHNQQVSLKAARDLTDFYYSSSGRLDRALQTATLASIISLTLLDNALRQKDFEYTWAGFTDMMKRIGKTPSIMQWAQEEDIWQSFLLLALIVGDRGKHALSESILMDLASSCPDPVIVTKARSRLNTIP